MFGTRASEKEIHKAEKMFSCYPSAGIHFSTCLYVTFTTVQVKIDRKWEREGITYSKGTRGGI